MVNQLTNKFEEALNSMPGTFTSEKFVNKLREMGVPIYSEEITQGRSQRLIKNFLLPRCIRKTSRSWEKHNITSSELNEEQAINFLKSLGYKIIKQTITYEEV